MFLLSFPLRGEYFRYLDLTPAMEVLPRGPAAEEIAADMKCFQVTGTADSMVVRGFQRGEPFKVFELSCEIVILDRDSTDLWLMDGFSYRIDKDAASRPLLLSRMDPEGETFTAPDNMAFVQWEWENDTTVTVFSLSPGMERQFFKLRSSYTGTAARLDDRGNLIYFSFQSVPALGFRYTLDSSGRALSRTAVDGEGHYVPTDEGISYTEYSYDSDGNTIFTSYHDSLGALLPRDYQLPSEGNWEFDEGERVVNGCRIAFIKKEYDDNSLYVSETNIGPDGEPVQDDQGRVVTLYEREIHGGITGSYWFDEDGAPVEIAGVWAARRIYDTQGRVTESSTWNSLDQLTEFPGGFAYTRFSYTPRGDVKMISYYDRSNNSAVNTVQGCHARSHYYDDSGNLIEIQYLDTGYRLMNNSAGYARTVFSYGEYGIRETHYDLNGTML